MFKSANAPLLTGFKSLFVVAVFPRSLDTMPITSGLADIAQKSMVLLLAGTTVYYMVNVGVLVNRRIGLKKEGKLQDELARLNGISPPGSNNAGNGAAPVANAS